MAWQPSVTSAELTCDANLDFLLSGSDVMVAAPNPRELMEFEFNIPVVAGTPTDNVDWEVLGGARLTSGNTSQSGGSTSTIKMASAETFADSELVGCFVIITSGTQQGKWGLITANVNSTDLVTVSTASGSGFGAAPDAMTYDIYKFRPLMAGIIDTAALAVENLHTPGGSIVGVPYVAFRAARAGSTDAHKVRATYQLDGVSA